MPSQWSLCFPTLFLEPSRACFALEGQKILFIIDLSVAEETFMETLQEERFQPNLAPLEAEGQGVFWLLVCAGPEGARSTTGRLPQTF